VFVVSRISTGIANPSIGQSDLYSASGSKAGRVSAKFMRGLKDLQYRFLNATNWKCKTAPPRNRDGLSPASFREQDFLRKLSKGTMDSLDTMLGLVRLSDVNPNAFSDLKVTRNEARRMLDNLDAHGELFHALSVEIDRSSQTGYLNFLGKIKGNYETLAKVLMVKAGYSGSEFKPAVDIASSGRLVQAMEFARGKIISRARADHGVILQEALVKAKDERRALHGTAKQKEFAAQLAEFRSAFKAYGTFRPKLLTEMMTSALRKVGVDAPDNIVRTTIERLNSVPGHDRAKLLPPLLEAMSDVIDGVGSARHDFRRAIGDIAKAAKQTQLGVDRLNNLAETIAGQNPKGDEEFIVRAKEHLGSLSHKNRMSLLTLVDIKSTTTAAPLIQKALRSMADETVLDLIAKNYLDYGQGENPDALVSNIATIDNDLLLVIANFFDRNPWIPSSFEDAAAGTVEGPILSLLIAGFDDLAHAKFELVKPTSLSAQQEQDRKAYLEKVDETGDAWKALLSFIGDEIATQPQDRGEE
jgi:hypothetical protein